MDMLPGDQDPKNGAPTPEDDGTRHSAFEDSPSPFAEPTLGSKFEKDRQRSGRQHPVLTALAWLVITVIAFGVAVLVHVGSGAVSELAPIESEQDPGVAVFRLQARATVLAGNSAPGIEEQVRSFEVGSIPQRLRYLVYVSEMLGPEEAMAASARLREQMDEFGEPRSLYMTEDQMAVQDILDGMYRWAPAGEEIDLVERVAELSADERDLLNAELGWFGKLALYPEGTPDTNGRDEIMRDGRMTTTILVTVFVVAIVVGLLGFIGLMALTIAAFMRRVQSGIVATANRSGIYAETFALWLLLFIGGSTVLEIVTVQFPEFSMGIAGLWFFLSLSALLWPVVRGVPWRIVREDIGLTAGRKPLLEPLMGVAGYAMTLPILFAGVVLTFILMQVSMYMQGTETESFTPAGGGAHPIIGEVASGDLSIIIQVLFVAAVAAPVVEEIMFRGVLYRHLRDATREAGFTLSFLLSGTINSFIFAMIHPQGWVAIPALMALAYGFTMMREWRGTLIPSILMHAINNFTVMMMLTLALS